jgi:nitronate monooxygenase
LINTRVSALLKIMHLIIQGPFGGGLSSVELLAAVSNLGGLGSFGAHHMTPEDIETLDLSIRKSTGRPYAINLWISDHDEDGLQLSVADFEKTYQTLRPYFDELGLDKPDYPSRFGQVFEEQIEVLLRVRPPVFSFVFGVPDKAILKECQARSIVTLGTAATVDEAVALDEAGVDLIVATGFEAGGHRVSFLKRAEDSLNGLMALIPQVVDNVRAPVIAAGGIADRRGARAAFSLGAEGVQVGTAFLATSESNAGLLHRSMLHSKEARATGLTRAFSGRLARGIENRFMVEMREQLDKIAPYPAQGWFTGKLKRAAIAQGRVDLMSLWCGQGAPLLKHHTAAEVFQSVIW